MSGHSKWSTIKHKKGAADAKRGKLFSKLSRAIMVAAKEGGADPASNLALQNAIEKARSYSMPKDNIERAIAKGAGEGTDGASFETVVYEGYGPEGVAVIVEALTDNRNRTASEVRHLFSKHGGNLGRDRRRRLAVRAARRRARRRPTASTRTSSCSPRPTPAPRTSSATGRASSSPPRPRSSRASARRSRAPATRSSRSACRWCRRRPSRSPTSRPPSRSCASWRGSRRTTTSRTSTRTSTSPRQCWRPSSPGGGSWGTGVPQRTTTCRTHANFAPGDGARRSRRTGGRPSRHPWQRGRCPRASPRGSPSRKRGSSAGIPLASHLRRRRSRPSRRTLSP